MYARINEGHPITPIPAPDRIYIRQDLQTVEEREVAADAHRVLSRAVQGYVPGEKHMAG
jgi:hypothetical protein